MNRSAFVMVSVSLLLSCATSAPPSATTAGATADDGWVTLFDGKTMTNWQLKEVHRGHGGVWTIEDGVLVGDQDAERKGGLLGTDKKYSDFEIELEFKADWPADSGLFLRTTEDGSAYQGTLDYRDDGSVGSLYNGGYLQKYPEWEKLYDKTGWNKMRARIEGVPARVQIWLNGTQTVDFTDAGNKFPEAGYIGLQVHNGEKAWGLHNKFRFQKIRIKNLAH